MLIPSQPKLLHAHTTQQWMNSTEVQNPWHKLNDHKCLCLVLFLPVQSLLTCFRSFLTHFVHFVTNNSSSDTKAFLRFITFSGFPTAVHHPLHALRYYTVGIPFRTTCKGQSQTSKFDGKATIPHAQVTWSHITITYVLQRNIRKHCTWRKWLT